MAAWTLLAVLALGEVRCPEDACLRGIAFLDPANGWVVGDDGAIWRTTDGGATWERQSGGTRGSLRRVVFQDDKRGWICGREDGPSGAAGVLLVTRDGGASWQRVLAGAVPALHGIAFVSETDGFLWGEAAGAHSSGLFKTRDGGRSWSPVAGTAPGGWSSGWFDSIDSGVLVGLDGRVQQFTGKEWAPIPADSPEGQRALACLGGMACGTGGMLICQQNGRWSLARTHLDTRALGQVAWRALARQGERVLVAGSPGGAVLLSEDGGRHFAPRLSGVPHSLYDACLVGEGTAYACGAMGVVIKSRDGGKTWEPVRRPLTHAAFLVATPDPARLPWRTIAQHGWEEGLAMAAVAVSSQPEPFGLLAAHRHAGLVTTETARGGPGWRERLVLALRQHQPEHFLVATGAGDRKAWLLEASGAAQWASDPSRFPEQIEALGLKPWRGGVAWRAASGEDATVRVTGQRPSDRLEDTPEGHAEATLALFGINGGEPTPYEGWAAINPGPGGPWRSLLAASSARLEGARRPLPMPEPLDASATKALEQRRLHEALARPGALAPADAERSASGLGATLDRLDDARGAPFLDRLASGAERSGRWQLARELRAMLVDRYPAHPLALASTRWLIGHESSGEVRRREELARTVERSIMQAGMPGANGNGSGGTASRSSETITRVTRETAILEGPALTRKTLETCLAREMMLRASGSLAAQDPGAQFMLQSARRQLGQFQPAFAYYKNAAESLPRGSPWQTAAEMELWLANRTGEPPRPALPCRQAPARPHLDGRLEDPCWQNALRPMEGASSPTLVAMAFDADFLYLAARCQGVAPDGGVQARGRKPDSADETRDRITFFLDIDRDHATGYTLTIDDRGQVADRCCLDPTWDPRWFVAVAREEDGWAAEAAIPLSALTGGTVTTGQAWLAQVVRGRGNEPVATWSRPRGAGPGAGFPGQPGLVLFLPSGKAR